ncbi:hypothetical protein [Mucilaginibacter paludis]|uniref:Uncharacterized protein n=1 Tax=Mucilaginibacter paludis DSM 18603 TaxID=714943 RepID=H1YAZ2_9SPHI|nr:hypothetical protein [Mucilaginibacter paludis]EHQ30025.1 hypothetical protein Mucpa_5965 [Mucilaginibacter paludis DSM 18603]
MTKEEVIKKAEELTVKEGVKVYPITFIGKDESDLVIGFIKEPSFLVKARAMDKVYTGMGFSANLEILSACLLTEHSDPRLLSETYPNDRYKLGAAKYCGDLLLMATDQTEKKSD